MTEVIIPSAMSWSFVVLWWNLMTFQKLVKVLLNHFRTVLVNEWYPKHKQGRYFIIRRGLSWWYLKDVMFSRPLIWKNILKIYHFKKWLGCRERRELIKDDTKYRCFNWHDGSWLVGSFFLGEENNNQSDLTPSQYWSCQSQNACKGSLGILYLFRNPLWYFLIYYILFLCGTF